MKLPERWTLLRANPPTIDDATGQPVPSLPTAIPWTGLLQQKFIRTDQNEIGDGVVVSELVLMLDPGISVDRRDVFRFDGPDGDVISVGDTVQVVGSPRARRPARGSRRVAFIAATVRHTTDIQE